MYMVAETLPEERIAITDNFRWNLLQRKAAETRAQRAFSLFRQHGIEPILIKGLAADRFYPECKLRGSVDMDMAVSANDFEAARAISKSSAANGLAIDLHRELRHHDTVGWDDLFENSLVVEFDQGSIRILRPEDHLRVLCVHWLTDGGANKDRLWDMYYAVENRSVEFDWDRFLNLVSDRRRRWLLCTLGLASRYLGLDLSNTPVERENTDIPEWIVRTVEREWAKNTQHLPLHIALGDTKLFWKQILKRLRPNPIWATVQMEGSFDAKTRVFYQLGSIFQRIVPSYRRVSDAMNASN